MHRIFFLKHGDTPAIEQVLPTEAVQRCLTRGLVFGFRYMQPTDRQTVLSRLLRLFRTVPAYVLHFRKDNSFWRVIDELEEARP